MGVGVTPRDGLAAAAGSASTTASSWTLCAAPSIPFSGGGRVGHWANALNQAARAGRDAAGEREAHDRVPYFYSHQYDLGLEHVGHGDTSDHVVVRGDGRELVAFWLRDGRVRAAMNVNVWDGVDDLKALSGTAPDPARLADPDVPLGSVRGAPA